MQYSISDLEQLSGISVHNIRMWERRYNALQPSRTTGNTRLYDDDQLKRLLNIAGLYYAGHKISKACAMTKEETASFLEREIESTISLENQYEYYISQIIVHGMAYREQDVRALITQSFNAFGVLATYKFIMYPLLMRLGLMWQQDSLCPSQEHFLSAIFRQKLYAATDGCAAPKQGADKWLLFLPEDEDHELGLLLANYLLRMAGKQVIFLGAKVPLSALKNAADLIHPDKILFFMTRIRPVGDAQSYLNILKENFQTPEMYLAGTPRLLSELVLPNRVNWLREIPEFEKLLKSEN